MITDASDLKFFSKRKLRIAGTQACEIPRWGGGGFLQMKSDKWEKSKEQVLEEKN